MVMAVAILEKRPTRVETLAEALRWNEYHHYLHYQLSILIFHECSRL